jgi:hypothetical protein
MAKSKKMTKPQSAKMEKLRQALSDQQSAIYAFGESRNVVFSECYKLATPEAKKAYDASWQAVMSFEGEMIGEGRGWRNAYGHFYSY